MIKDEIIALAREAGFNTGFHAWYTQPNERPDYTIILERFAKLVAEHEREACAKVCESRLLADASEEQRIGYECAKKRIAADIRARSEA